MGKGSLKGSLDVIQSISIILGIGFTCFQIYNMSRTYSAAQKVASATIVLKISEEVNKDKYSKIYTSINDHDSKFKILSTKTHKGYSDHQLEDYIGNFETLGNLAKDEVVIEQMVYNELSYEIEKAWCNQDVNKYIQEARKVDGKKLGPDALYIGFEEQAKYCLDRDKKTCVEVDQEYQAGIIPTLPAQPIRIKTQETKKDTQY